MTDYTQFHLPFASIEGKKVEADFDGGTLTSDSGVLFLREVESRIGIIDRIVNAISDNRNPSYIDHTLDDLIRQRVFQIGCGYPDANDCDRLRQDPAMKSACDRLPITGAPLASQPTMSRLENIIRRTELYRIAHAFVDCFIASYDKPPEYILLDVDDTDDPTHGAQQEALFNAYYDEYCYEPLHIYEGLSGKLITTILRPGKRPTGQQTVAILERVVAPILEAWPEVKIVLRGDSHFSTPEVHDWCKEHSIYFILGQTSTSKLKKRIQALLTYAQKQYDKTEKKVKLFMELEYQADTWSESHRIICKVEVTDRGQNIRFVVTNFESSQPSFIYSMAYCGRGQMENFIKNHKNDLRSDRTSCHSFGANQFRLFLHSAAYVLLHALQTIGLKGTQWAKSQFNTIQLHVLKIGARVRELKTRIKFHLPTSYSFKEDLAKLSVHLTAFRR